MSEDTWIAESYPVFAWEAPKMTWRQCILASLRKWRGLRKVVLKKHGISEPPVFIGWTSCHLCVKDGAINSSGGPCYACPLFRSREYVTCDAANDAESLRGHPSPFHAYTRHGDPEPMIAALELALDWEKKNRKKGGAQ